MLLFSTKVCFVWTGSWAGTNLQQQQYVICEIHHNGNVTVCVWSFFDQEQYNFEAYGQNIRRRKVCNVETTFRKMDYKIVISITFLLNRSIYLNCYFPFWWTVRKMIYWIKYEFWVFKHLCIHCLRSYFVKLHNNKR